MNSNGEMVHPSIIPTFRHCHEVVNFEVVKQNCRSWKYDFTRVVMVSDDVPHPLQLLLHCASKFLEGQGKVSIH
ncbi:unnamed protein product, partial [Lampetra planeri]